jgi:Holliday junction resolvasome RuvABC endonuclease subunit
MAIDFGAKTGIAIGTVDGGKLSDVICCIYHAEEDQRYWKYAGRIGRYISECNTARVVYANAFHPPGAGNNASHLWGGYHASACIACARHGLLEPIGYSEMTAKKYFTGRGNASKADVLAACEEHGLARHLPLVGKRNPKPSEDAADALMLLCFAGEVRL